MPRPVRVLHVTQASSGGVLNAMIQLAKSQLEVGVEVSVMYTERTDTPSQKDLAQLFGPNISLIRVGGRGMGPAAAWNLMLSLLRTLRAMNPDALHLHSSFAGAVGRVAAFVARRSTSTYYSPHGFAFLRQDLTARAAKAVALAERCFHTLGSSMILVSESEKNAASLNVSKSRLFVLENGLALNELPKLQQSGNHLRVGSAGRVAYQKAPWRFAGLAKELRELADFHWIGGASKDVDDWLPATAVSVSGWLTEEEALKRLSELDIYVSTSLWEGLPISVMQAQALGVPCVVSNCVGNVDLVEHEVTGFIYDTDEELVEYVATLVKDQALRRRLGVKAQATALQRFDQRRLGPASLLIYNCAHQERGYSYAQ